jgi:hypothetical protein
MPLSSAESVSQGENPHRLVALEDVLRLLDEAGPLSSDQLARELGLLALDARILMLRAHWQGMVRTTSGRQWAISDRGREVLAGNAASPSISAHIQRLRAAASGLVWRQRLRPRYVARGGVSLALAAVVCLAGVAVASNTLPLSSGPPALPAPHVKHVTHRPRRRLSAQRRFVVSQTVITSRHYERSRVYVTVTRARGLDLLRISKHRHTSGAGQRARASGRHTRARGRAHTLSAAGGRTPSAS